MEIPLLTVVVLFVSCSNVTIVGINWESCGYNDQPNYDSIVNTAVGFYNSSNITIGNCSFYRSAGQALMLSNSQNILVSSCNFTHNNIYTGHGAAIHYSPATVGKLPSFVINNCVTCTLSMNGKVVIAVNPMRKKNFSMKLV